MKKKVPLSSHQKPKKIPQKEAKEKIYQHHVTKIQNIATCFQKD
jgi:hypothetical protein